MNFLEKALQRLWFGCGGACHAHGQDQPTCPLLDTTDLTASVRDPAARRFSHGGPLAAAAATVFLFPLATAMGGAYLAGRYVPPFLGYEWAQLLGLLGGMAAGVGLARCFLLLARPGARNPRGDDA